MKYRASDYLALPEVAETLGCSRQTVYRLIETAELAGMQLKDHGWWKVSKRSLDQYVERRMGPKRQRPEAQKRASREPSEATKKRKQGRKE